MKKGKYKLIFFYNMERAWLHLVKYLDNFLNN